MSDDDLNLLMALQAAVDRAKAARHETCGEVYGSNPDPCYQPIGHSGTHTNRWGTTWAATPTRPTTAQPARDEKETT